MTQPATREEARGGTPAAWDVAKVRRDFPALDQTVHGRPLVYLDSAATALKPQAVIDAVTGVYAKDCANVHRGVHLLSQRATLAFEAAREKTRRFVNARETSEIVFVRGTTEAINLLAQTLGRRVGPGDEILITALEHHSNLVPWQMACEATGATLTVAEVSDTGEVTVEAVAAKLTDRTRIVALAHASNTLGTVLPVAEIARLAHQRGAVVVVDGAQAAPHLRVDVQALDADFYAFSGHKVYGPTGIGVLYGKKAIFESLPPWQGGGSMIRSVSLTKTTYKGLPDRFEAGTPDIAGAIGLGAAIDYLDSFDRASLEAYEARLLAYGTAALERIPGLRLIGTAKNKIGVLSFVMEGVHPHDLGTLVDGEGVAIRTGHHCTQPLMERFCVPATARASLGIYNTETDIDRLVAALRKAKELFS
ncbi:MAG TPA: cysteine desulfurase [Polyangiaceae bacterium]|jgi:cysteine desulfurase/selenocysteine lyase|nr:cysteine desulfurase [Polyangiaceae bacterium]